MRAASGCKPIPDKIVETVARRNSTVIFLLWSNYSQQKAEFLRSRKCAAFEAAQASLLSVNFENWQAGHRLEDLVEC